MTLVIVLVFIVTLVIVGLAIVALIAVAVGLIVTFCCIVCCYWLALLFVPLIIFVVHFMVLISVSSFLNHQKHCHTDSTVHG